ncbi:hypothetical protein HWD31_gp12 [Pantoea phage vB_PagM_SSEM1]|uniref:Uncharacterized protein n=1 Tax=Pantoea phage vB_PagM_SSEM1 TaxID=2721760 RepID=A0A6H0D8G2_9CAUD|nr:hypothetical protein HWD31_gp12 [Pantoea phage vB_PagM_SSEM1]QIS79354.1 hypothetical protein SSEM1_gp12 [Pantoea phage vB_PagM_SSEM1]
MSNLIAFNSVVHRAQVVEENRGHLNEEISIQVPTSVILFADKHIRMMEEQQLKMQRELTELRAIASCAKVDYARIQTFNHPSLN